jgi:hypothetical protein
VRQKKNKSAPPIADASLADRTREAYLQRREELNAILGNSEPDLRSRPIPRWDGGVDSYGRQHSPIWPRIAEFLRQRGIGNPVHFISANMSAGCPLPPELMTENAVKRYYDYEECLPGKIACRLNGDVGRFEFAVLETRLLYPELTSDREVCEHVLRNHVSPDLSMLFRYCKAVSEKMASVAEIYEDLALEEFQHCPELYREHWKNILPARLMDPDFDVSVALEELKK